MAFQDKEGPSSLKSSNSAAEGGLSGATWDLGLGLRKNTPHSLNGHARCTQPCLPREILPLHFTDAEPMAQAVQGRAQNQGDTQVVS